MPPSDAFARILAALQRAALDDAHWPAASALIDEAVGVTGNSLTVSERVGDVVRVCFTGLYRRGERRQDLERAYFEDYYAHDERRPRLISAPDGQLLHAADLYNEKELKTSPAFNEGARLLGSQNGLNVRFDGPDGLHVLWCTADPVARDGWQSTQLQLIEPLIPHIRHFVLVRQALAGADALGAPLTGLLDNSRIGVLQLDRGGRVLAANAPALAILRNGDGLSDRGGALHASLADDDERLQKLLGRALPGLWGATPAAGAMHLHRLSHPAPLGLHVSPAGNWGADFGGRRVAALVLVVDPAERPQIDPQRVAEAFDLKKSEGRVTALLAEGRTVAEIARVTGFRPGYVRVLLKRVYKKMGVSGQVAVVPRVLGLAALPRR